MELNPLAIQQQIDPGFRSNPTLHEFTESPCKTCHNRNHDKDECLTGCPIFNPPKTPISSFRSQEDDTPTEDLLCAFPGCAAPAKKSRAGCYCPKHNRIVYPRRFEYGWPEERWHDPVGKRQTQQCGFPGCKETQTQRYCHAHKTLINNRKYKYHWPESRCFEPVNTKFRPKGIK